jgi:phosphatidate cytidylyltransferase
MGSRILSTILLWALVVGVVLGFGPTGGVWLVALIAVLTQWEFFALMRRLGVTPFDKGGTFVGAVLCLAPLYFERFGLSVMPGAGSRHRRTP